MKHRVAAGQAQREPILDVERELVRRLRERAADLAVELERACDVVELVLEQRLRGSQVERLADRADRHLGLRRAARDLDDARRRDEAGRAGLRPPITLKLRHDNSSVDGVTRSDSAVPFFSRGTIEKWIGMRRPSRVR